MYLYTSSLLLEGYFKPSVPVFWGMLAAESRGDNLHIQNWQRKLKKSELKKRSTRPLVHIPNVLMHRLITCTYSYLFFYESNQWCKCVINLLSRDVAAYKCQTMVYEYIIHAESVQPKFFIVYLFIIKSEFFYFCVLLWSFVLQHLPGAGSISY